MPKGGWEVELPSRQPAELGLSAMNSFEVQGKWWLPKNSEAVPGVLRFTPSNGATLELQGNLDDRVSPGERHEAIHGITVEGTNYTLFSPVLTHRTKRDRGIDTASYRSTLVLRGAHYESESDVRIRGIRCRYWSLDEWVNISGIELELVPEVVIRYREPEDIVVDLDLKELQLRFSIEFSASYPAWRYVQTNASLEQKTWLGLEALEDLLRLDQTLHLVRHLQDFLTLGIGKPTYVLECRVILDNATGHLVSDGVNLNVPVEAMLFWPQLYFEEQKPLFPFQMLFTREDLGDRLSDIIRNWFVHRSRLQGMFDLYFGALYNAQMYVESKFLSYVQALELYHRVLGSTKQALPKEEHARLVESLVQATPEKYRKWVEGKLKYNEPNLRQRLREVWRAHEDILEEYVGDRNGFINKVVVTRNYLVHQDESLRDEAAKDDELVRINCTLSLMIRLCLLGLLGMSREQSRSLLERHGLFLRGLWGQVNR